MVSVIQNWLSLRATSGIVGRTVMGMHTRNVEFSSVLAVAEARQPQAGPAPAASFQFWRGASGRRYVHSIFDLIACPRLPACTYVLVRRDEAGTRQVLRIGTVSAEAWSLNLAEIRHRAARLGANEVHTHLLANDAALRSRIAADLQAGQFAEVAAEPAEAPERLC